MKHRLFTCVFIFFACLTVVGQVNQVWWSKGRVLHVNPVAGIDSVTYGQFVNADTFLIVIDRASRRIVHDTIDEHVPGMVFHDTIRTTHTIYLKPGRRIGVFSVAKDRQVSFSQGNLQYVRNQDVWKFADQQYEYIGAGNIKDGKLANKIDLFGWSGDNTTAPFGVSTSTKVADYAGDFVDWGVNEINGDAPNTWRTLSKDEWEYLFEKRKNAQKLYGVAQVNGSNGIIILPDNWSFDNGISFKTGLHSVETDDYSIFQSFTDQEFSVLESFGAVFIHASGWREGISIEKSQRSGYYWSSTPYNNTDAYRMTFYSYYLKPCDIHYKYRGRSVRLVHDTIVPPPAPCETFEVNGVKFNMMCVEGGTFTMGAGSDAHQVTLSDYYIGETEVTQGLWKAVMGGELPPRQEIMGDEYPVADISMVDCRRFVERLTELTGRHFRIPTEAEWEYAARGGVKSKGYKYAGSDDINEVAIWKGTVRLDENGKEIYAPEPVMTRKPNELGIYDMSGNLAEWVNDWNGEFNLYPQINPTGPTTYTTTYSHRVHYRGGCWTFPEYKCEVTFKQPKNVPSITDPNRGFNGIGLRLVLSDEEPFKMVYLNDSTRIVLRPVKGEKYDYYIGETEVTYALWKAVMGTVLGVEETDNKPVSRVSWDDCQKFIAKLNELTGLHFRLPTEAEWEYAARGGSRSNGYMFAGSNDIDSVGWYMINSDSTDHCVAQLMSNELGIYDMTGNVWEWCQDYYDVNQTMHVVKSGSWFDAATACRIDARTGRAANYKSFIGFRIVLDAHQYVDLGLSVKWATFNLGASAPEEYGDYFAWGETEAKDVYDWSTYKWCDGTVNNITKYNATDGLKTLQPEDDAAHVNWGGEWRMPTDAELQELIDNCTWEWDEINGTEGYYVTSNINNNHIFISAGGYKIGDGTSAINRNCQYWSNTLCNDLHAFVYHAYKSGSHVKKCTGSNRSAGQSVRPVLPTNREVLPPVVPGKRIGVFSVAKDKQVSFSQGNLQYVQSLNHWRFADNQLYYTGERHLRNGQIADTVMYFGWSAKDSPTLWGIGLETNVEKYKGEFLDWGVNEIQGDKANTWRTMSNDEWIYLFTERKNAAQLMGRGKVDDINGVILLPDNWVLPDGLSFAPIDDAVINHYTAEQWAKMESVGAVFIAAAGYFNNRLNPKMRFVGEYAYAASCNTLKDGVLQLYNAFTETTVSYSVTGTSSTTLYYAFLRRLVHDTIVPSPAPCETFEVNGIEFNMMRVEGGTFMMGAMEGDTRANANEKPAHEVTLTYDYYMGQTEVTQGLWKAVMGSDNNPSTMKGDDLPVNNVLWEDAQEFVYKLSQMTGLSFDLPTEAEWQFAARGGNRSKGYLYAGSDNADDVAWYSSNSGGVTHTVATKQPNELGIYDMSGNVFEWCSDWLAPYSAEAQVDPKGPISGEYHVYCGGGWYLGSVHCRSSHRRQTTAGYTEAALGFRVVLREKVEPEYVDLGLSNRGIMIEKFIILYKKELFNL